MKENKIILCYFILSIFLLNAGCKYSNGEQTRNTIEYYYPEIPLANKKVYCYKYKADNQVLFNGYEILWSERKGDSVLIHMETYLTTLQASDYFIFELDAESINLKSHTQRKREPYILQDYKSNVISNLIIQNKDESFDLEYNNEFQRVKRVRQFINKKEDTVFEGENYPAIEFSDKLTITKHQTGQVNQIERTSIYCKGIGLYQSINKYSDGRVVIKTLDKIISFEEWEANIKEEHIQL
jgi:hypothetical protein